MIQVPQGPNLFHPQNTHSFLQLLELQTQSLLQPLLGPEWTRNGAIHWSSVSQSQGWIVLNCFIVKQGVSDDTFICLILLLYALLYFTECIEAIGEERPQAPQPNIPNFLCLQLPFLVVKAKQYFFRFCPWSICIGIIWIEY